MADYTRRERTKRYIEYAVPVWADHGAAIGEFMKALAVAEREVVQAKGEKAVSWDDWCRVVPGDEEIIIRIEVSE